MMNRYAVIENHSGYVWWVGDADSPEAACAKADLETNLESHTYEPTDNRDGSLYFVYCAPAGFDVDDGQDQAQIDAVSALPLVGRYRVVAS